MKEMQFLAVNLQLSLSTRGGGKKTNPSASPLKDYNLRDFRALNSLCRFLCLIILDSESSQM